MMNKSVGIYIHVPFCLRKCLYCDFCSFEGTDALLRQHYVEALIREIRSYAPRLAGYTADTVYFGGGTPASLTAAQTKSILEAVRETVSLSEDAEITSEVNPASADIKKLCAWRQMGINRLSIGVQSFQNEELVALGRLHTAEEAECFFHAARKAGFENISMDLMYGIPGETRDSFRETLARTVQLSPEHISAYALKVEEGTPFAKMRASLSLPSEDDEVAMYEDCIEILGGAGYRHYEISNYARTGFESRHNLRYWKMMDYIGVGLAAYSCFEGKRYGCDRDMASYITRDFSHFTPVIEEPCDPEEETVMLGLRLQEGIDEEMFRARFGYGFREKYGARLKPYLAHGLVSQSDAATFLTDRGMYVSLGILAEILD